MNELKTLMCLKTDGLCSEYREDVRRFMTFSDGILSIDSMREFFEDLSKRCKPATIQRHRCAIKKAILLSIDTNDIAQRVAVDILFENIPKPKVKKQANPNAWLTEREISRLVQICGYKTSLIIRALYHTACRESELCNIKLQDCLDKDLIVVINIRGTKNKKDRYVKIPKNLFEEIRIAYPGYEYLFPGEHGGPKSTSTVYQLCKRAFKKIGRPDAHPHTMRHSWASNKYQKIGIHRVSKYLGHSSVGATADYYLHDDNSGNEI